MKDGNECCVLRKRWLPVILSQHTVVGADSNHCSFTSLIWVFCPVFTFSVFHFPTHHVILIFLYPKPHSRPRIPSHASLVPSLQWSVHAVSGIRSRAAVHVIRDVDPNQHPSGSGSIVRRFSIAS